MLDDTSTWPGTPIPDSIMAMCGLDMSIEADLVAYDECDNVLVEEISFTCLLYTSPSPRDRTRSRMPSSALKKKTHTTILHILLHNIYYP